MVRKRTQFFDRPKGFGRRNGVIFPGSNGTTYGSNHYCEDFPDSGDCDPLVIHHSSIEGGLINRNNPGFFGSHFENYVADGLSGMSLFPDQDVPDKPSSSWAATNGAARTNPSRPYVDLPVSIGELHEIPMLIRDAGRSFLRRAASANIKYQFGIAPLAGDIAKLMNFEDQVSRRIKEVERLVAKGGLRRTVVIGTYSNSGDLKRVVQSNGVFIEPTFQWNKTVVVKVHCRWKPSVSMQSLHMAGHRRALVERALLGLGAFHGDIGTAVSQAWELIPFSWLADYMGNIGQYLSTFRNTIPSELHKCLVMENSTLKYECASWGGGGTTTMSGIVVTANSKTRFPGTIAPAAHFPFLSGRQVGILGSLAVLRSPRYR